MTFFILIGLLACQTSKTYRIYYFPGEIKSKNDLILEYSKAFRVLKHNNLIGVTNENKN